MDSMDGLVGGWSSEQRLEIMKDSRIGSYGALSIWFVLTLKWLLLSELLKQIESAFLGLILALVTWSAVQVIARLTPLILMTILEYVSLGNSKAASMIGRLSKRDWWLASAPAVLMLLCSFDFSELLFVMGALCFLWWGLKQYLKNKIQGFNGDTLGASEQLTEVLVLFMLLVSFS